MFFLAYPVTISQSSRDRSLLGADHERNLVVWHTFLNWWIRIGS